MTAPERAELEAGLMITAAPDASPASTPPAGIATGKFHGGITATSFWCTGFAPSTCSSSWPSIA